MRLKYFWLIASLSLNAAFSAAPGLEGLVLRGSSSAVVASGFEASGINLEEINTPQKEKLVKVLERYLSQPITEEVLQAIRQDILTHYESCGRPLVIVTLPEQEVSSGALQLCVTEAKLGEVRVRGNRHFSSKSISDHIKLVPGEAIDQDTLIQNISYVNKHPFRQAQFVYTPGQDPDSTDIELIVEERAPFRAYAGAESTGRQQLSRMRYFTGFQWGKFLGMNNQTFSYQYATAENFNYAQSHHINYTVFLPGEQVMQIFGGYSRIRSMLTDNVAKSKGFSVQASLRYALPLPVENDYTHEIVCGGDYKRMNNATEFIILTNPRRRNVNLTQLALGYMGRLKASRLEMSSEVYGFYSPGKWLADQTQTDYSAIRPNTKPQYVYFTSKWAAVYTLPLQYTLSTVIQTQLSFKNLLPSEQFALGGHNTVRGYGEGDFTCDQAFAASLELKTPSMRLTLSDKQKWKDSLQAVAFIDYGVGRNHQASAGLPKRRWLLGIGPGVRYHLGNNFSFRLDWGFRCHDGTIKDSLISFGSLMVF